MRDAIEIHNELQPELLHKVCVYVYFVKHFGKRSNQHTTSVHVHVYITCVVSVPLQW